jgi:hypothetical protein
MMNTTIRHRAHRGVAVAVLALWLTGCAAEVARGQRRGARLRRHAADDHRHARPVRAGEGWPVTRQLGIDGARREFDYEVGELAY